MNIGFDAKRYFHNQTGLGNYSRDLINELIKGNPNDQFYLFDKKPSTNDFPQNTHVISPKKKLYLWREHGIIKDIESNNIDVFHGLSNEIPFGKWNSNIKKVVTIHDAIFKVFPSYYPLLDRTIYNFKTKHAINNSDKIICTSNATANQLKHYYNANSDKLITIYQTCHSSHWEIYTENQINAFKIKYQLQRPFILYLSSFQKRKNHLNLLISLKKTQNKNIHLVFAGKGNETLNSCKQYCAENNLNNQVTFIHDIPLSDLPLLYRSANAFIYPSLIEGFGIPLIEAACAGLPIAASDIEVFKEIAPKDTIYFNPNDPDTIKSSLESLYHRNDKIDYSLELEKFNKTNTANQVYQLYKSM